ncbi:MAG: hypothetical protein ACLP59_26180 [Bryobacteraceae bacterium]
MNPSHGQLLALYFLLVVDSALSRYLSNNINANDANHDGGIAANLATYFKALQITLPTLPSMMNLYVNNAIVQTPSTVLTTLGLDKGYSSGSGPCPSIYEEAAIIRGFDLQFPWPQQLTPLSKIKKPRAPRSR